MAKYTKRDVADKIGRSHRNITYWTDFGLIIPDIQPSQGRGIARIYSDRNLVEFGMIEIMNKDFGVSLDTIREILQVLRRGTIQIPNMNHFLIEKTAKKFSEGIDEFLYREFYFDDFYQNDEWGESKELMAIDRNYLGYTPINEELKEDSADRLRMHWGISYHVIDAKFDFNDIFKEKAKGNFLFSSHYSYDKILWLGSIKKAAAKKLGVNLESYKKSAE